MNPEVSREDDLVVRDSAGITIVENDHRRPKWTNGSPWTLSSEPRVRIGAAYGDSTQQLYRVIDSKRLADGRIAVVNSGSAEIRIYDERGRFLHAIGRRGDGPGEFRIPWAIHHAAGDSLMVVDIYRQVSVLDAEGNFGRRFVPERPEGKVMGEGFEPVDQFGDGSLLFRYHHSQDPSSTGIARTRIQMIRVTEDGSFAGSLGDFDDQTANFGRGAPPYLFGPWAQEAASDSTMWYGPGDRFELREVGYDGQTQRLVRLDRPPRAVTTSDIENYKASVTERVRRTGREASTNRRLAASEFAPEFPAHLELRVDAAGNLWVQDYGIFTEREARNWAVFDSQGRFLGDVSMPPAFAVHEIGDTYVLGRWTDEMDVEYVLLFDIIKPGS